MTSAKFTKRELVLMHLLRNHPKEICVFAMSFTLTQDGIAMALGISRAHVSILLKEMLELNFVEYMQAHVNSGRVMRRVYYLTPEGRIKADEAMNYAKRNGIDVNSLFMDREQMKNMPHDPSVIRTMKFIEEAQDVLLNIQKHEYVDYVTVVDLLTCAIKEIVRQPSIKRRG